MRSTIRRATRFAAPPLASLLTALVGCASPAVRMQAHLAEVLYDQSTAWNRGDIEGFMQHYWKSDDLTFSAGGKTTHGWDSTLQRYRTRYPTPQQMGRLEFKIESVRPLGSRAALVLGRWQLTRNGDTFGGNFSLVFQRINGRWVIVHDHTSADDPFGSQPSQTHVPPPGSATLCFAPRPRCSAL